MNYTQYIKEAKLGNYNYVPPEDKKELMFDFYMSTLLTHTGDDDIDYAIDDLKKTLYPHLRQELLDVVLFAIMAELRHAPIQGENNFLKKYFKIYNRLIHSDLRFDAKFDQNTLPVSLRGSRTRRIMAYSAYKRTGYDSANAVKIAQKAFSSNSDGWEPSFGGKVWAHICNGWLKLNDAKTINEMQVWIDHIYDLQHNSDTVFNKVESYSDADKDHDWIGEALEFKKYTTNPYEIMEFVGISMQKIAGFILKKEGKETQQLYRDKMDENEVNLMKLWESIIEGEHISIIKELINKVTNFNVPVLNSVSPLLFLAIQNKEVDNNNIIKLIAQKTNLNRIFPVGSYASLSAQTALTLATSYGNTPIMKILLDLGADTSALNSDKDIALNIAVKKWDYKAVELLLKNDADVNHQGTDADVNHQGTYGEVPLLSAVVHENDTMCELLLKYGARVDIPNNEGDTPYSMALAIGPNSTTFNIIKKYDEL